MNRGDVQVRASAESDIDEIVLHILIDNPDAATRFLGVVKGCFSMLAGFPLAGTRRPGRDPRLANLRCWPIGGRFKNHLILYLPTESGVEILRVVHGARDVDTLIDDTPE